MQHLLLKRPALSVWRQDASRKFSWLSFGGKGGLLCAGLLLVWVMSACAGGTSDNTGNGTTSASPTPTATATATPTPTPTPQPPHMLTEATVGGLEAVFQTTYGPSEFTGTPKVVRYHFTINGVTGKILTYPDTGKDGKSRVFSMDTYPGGGLWGPDISAMILKAFLPPDATVVKTGQAKAGPYTVYLSVDLGLSLPKSVFVDSATSQPVTPGTFTVYCSGFLHNSDGGCFITPGFNTSPVQPNG